MSRALFVIVGCAIWATERALAIGARTSHTLAMHANWLRERGW